MSFALAPATRRSTTPLDDGAARPTGPTSRRTTTRSRDRPRSTGDPADVVRAIEAIVLVATEPVPPDLLAQLLELPVATVEQLCQRLAEAYDEAGHGFQLVRVAGGYRYQSHPDLAPYVERFVLEGQRARLSAAALETLAIVAYKQPISRAQVAAIRGVDPDAVLRTLQSRGYVDQVGPGSRARARPCCGARRRSSSSGWASTRWPTCRRSPSSCPAPTWSRRWRPGCASAGRDRGSDADRGRRRTPRTARAAIGPAVAGSRPRRSVERRCRAALRAGGDGEWPSDAARAGDGSTGSGCRRSWRSGATAAAGSART